jgi:hypothetical protein
MAPPTPKRENHRMIRADEPINGWRPTRDDPASQSLRDKICFTLAPALALTDTGFPPFGAFLRRRQSQRNQRPDCIRHRQYGAHSMRAGFLTSAASKGANLFKMMDLSRHKSVDTLRGYVRSADAFRDYAGAGLL